MASSQAMILSLREELDKAGETLDTEIASSQAKKEDRYDTVVLVGDGGSQTLIGAGLGRD